MLNDLIYFALSKHGAEMKDLVAETIAAARELRAEIVLSSLAFKIFPKHGAEMKDLIAETIAVAVELKNVTILNHLDAFTFSKHGAKMKDLSDLVESFLKSRNWYKLGEGLSKLPYLKNADFKTDTATGVNEFIQGVLNGTTQKGLPLKTESLGVIHHQEMIFSNRKIVVHKFTGDQEKEYVVKISRKESKDLSKERQRAQDYKQHGLSHADYFEGDARYSIREYIAGERGDQFIERWEQNGANKDDPQIIKLYELIEKMVDEVFYFGDLRPKT